MNRIPTPIDEIIDEYTKSANIRLFIKREELNHPTIQGNKYWKLLYNIKEAQSQNKDTLITFGGAFSNHIYATAAAGESSRIKTVGIIRGERIQPLNHTLQSAVDFGMELHFITREKYKEKQTTSFLDELHFKFNNAYIIPEGGTNSLAIEGCKELGSEIEQQDHFDTICLSVGTGGTISGLISSIQHADILGFSSLKGNFLEKEIENLIQDTNNNALCPWEINTAYHFGGYAKHKPELIEFINTFKQVHNIQLDPIYTGKMMFGIYNLMEKGEFRKNARVLAIHTGGVQGINGFNKRYGNIIL